MTLTKLAWVGALALGGLVALGPIARAQEKKDDKPAAPAPATPPPVVKPAAPLSREELRTRRVDARLKSMTKMFTLTDDQQTKIKPILEDEAKKMDEIQQDKALPMEERRKKYMEIREGSQAKMKAVLTPDQQQKMDSLQARSQRRIEPGAPSAPGRPATPAPPANPPAPAK